MYLVWNIHASSKYMFNQSTRRTVQYSIAQHSGLAQLSIQNSIAQPYTIISIFQVPYWSNKNTIFIKKVPGLEVSTLLEHVLVMKFEKQDSHSPPQISLVPRSMQYQNGAENDTVQDTKEITVATNPVTLYRPIADPQNTCRPKV